MFPTSTRASNCALALSVDAMPRRAFSDDSGSFLGFAKHSVSCFTFVKTMYPGVELLTTFASYTRPLFVCPEHAGSSDGTLADSRDTVPSLSISPDSDGIARPDHTDGSFPRSSSTGDSDRLISCNRLVNRHNRGPLSCCAFGFTANVQKVSGGNRAFAVSVRSTAWGVGRQFLSL